MSEANYPFALFRDNSTKHFLPKQKIQVSLDYVIQPSSENFQRKFSDIQRSWTVILFFSHRGERIKALIANSNQGFFICRPVKQRWIIFQTLK